MNKGYDVWRATGQWTTIVESVNEPVLEIWPGSLKNTCPMS